jgi:hypothetical protein
MAPKLGDIPENDGNHHLRDRIQRICSNTATHEERGQQLRDLMTESYRKACEPPPPSKKQKLKVGLPEMEKYAPRLQELPAELIEYIAVNLALKDFGHLRLVSRVLHRDSTPSFRKMFFARRNVRMEWESLRRLVNIVNDQHCGPALRHLTVDCEPPAPGPPQLPYRGRAGRQVFNVPRGRARPSYQPQPLLTSSSRRLQELLERAFSRIDRLQSLSLTSHPTSVVEEQEVTVDEAWTLRRSLCYEHLALVFEAIAQGNTRISCLRVGGSPNPKVMSFDYFRLSSLDRSTLSQNQVGLRRAFRDMTALEVVVWGSFHDTDQPEPSRSRLDFVVQLLSLTPNIHSFSLCLGAPALHGGGSCEDMDELSRNVKLPRLEKCAMHSVRLTTPILKRFLSASLAIREVHLDRVFLSEEDTEGLYHLLGNEREIQGGSIRRLLVAKGASGIPVRDVVWETGYPPRWVEVETDGEQVDLGKGVLPFFP